MSVVEWQPAPEPEPRRETCQRGCPDISIGVTGRVQPHERDHGIYGGQHGRYCDRSSHPSREELARRKARRAAKAAALVANLQPEAAATLDALLEGRTDEDARRLLERLDDMRRAALHEYNRRNSTKHRQPTHMGWCRFCRGRTGTDYTAHLTQCALECLAGLRDPAPPGTKVLPEEHRQENNDG